MSLRGIVAPPVSAETRSDEPGSQHSPGTQFLGGRAGVAMNYRGHSREEPGMGCRIQDVDAGRQASGAQATPARRKDSALATWRAHM